MNEAKPQDLGTWTTEEMQTNQLTHRQLRARILVILAAIMLFAWSESARAQWTTNGNNINNTNTGNVGIGTTSPATLLEVNGVARAKVQDKGGQVFNVLAYGALCDGSTDDYSAFLATYNALPSNGGIIRVPSNATCLLGTGLSMAKPSTWIVGGGWGSVIKAKNSAAVVNLLSWTNAATNSGIRDVKVDGNRANTGTDTVSGADIEIEADYFSAINTEVTGQTSLACFGPGREAQR